MLKLNVGSNDALLNGWVNIDLYGHNGAIQHDARTRFPYEDESVDFIFSEHFIEHLNSVEGEFFFKECHRMLKSGGVVRTATFNIDELMVACSSDFLWKEYSAKLLGGRFGHLARVEFLNFAIYEGNAHKWMYNQDEMVRLLKIAGFGWYEAKRLKESAYPDLQNLEWRENSTCIVEATK